MGQINTVLDSQAESDVYDRSNEEEIHQKDLSGLTEIERDSNLEQGQCVKTRIDMLIEEFLNTEKVTDKDTDIKAIAKHTEEAEQKDSQRSKELKLENKLIIEVKSDDDINKSGSLKVQKSEKKEFSIKTELEIKEQKVGLKVSDIITDMVSTELTQVQLKQLQQRTITTFNTFIDKVLDNSLSKECSELKDGKPNLLQLCTESLMPSCETKLENKKISDSEENESTEKKDHGSKIPDVDKDKESTKPIAKVSLKDHIEHFLEMSFRNDNFEDAASRDREKTIISEKNFNAQGLVDSMINQGLQINRLLTSKDQLKDALRPVLNQETQGRPCASEPKLRIRENQGQKDLCTSSCGKTCIPIPQITNSGLQDIISNSDRKEEYSRIEDILNRKEVIPKPQVTLREDHVSSAFHQPQHLHVSSKHNLNCPRMPVSTGLFKDIKQSVPHEQEQSIHMWDCACHMCVYLPQTKLGMEQHTGKHLPHFPLVRHSVVTAHETEIHMRQTKYDHSQGHLTYHGIHKLPSIHSASTAADIYCNNQLLVPFEKTPHDLVSGQRSSYPESYPGSDYHYRKDFPNSPVTNEHFALRCSQLSPCLPCPSSGQGQVPASVAYKHSVSGQSLDVECVRRVDSTSNSSDCSYDGPLDLSVKRPSSVFSLSRSNNSATGTRRIKDTNSFIKHLENSVDKYWQELNSPPQSPKLLHLSVNHPESPSNVPSSLQHDRNISGRSSSPNLLRLIPNRPLASPQYTGEITVGQPSAHLKPQLCPLEGDPHQNGSQVTSYQQQVQSEFTRNQSSSDQQRALVSTNISRHEPIQSIIGKHDPNDILYLICRICSQTYGSPYGFRKHFRNQHGYEPRADHTIVQTISATKNAMHLPHSVMIGGSQNREVSMLVVRSNSPDNESRVQIPTSAGNNVLKVSSASHIDSQANGGSEFDKAEFENSETKCLECPECGKTFQLNDFGLYKRHCRQHGHLRMNGPLACSDCHLPFPDQISLREHYTTHSQHCVRQQKSDVSEKNIKPHETFYSRVKCNKQSDNTELYSNHISSHKTAEEGDSFEKDVLVSKSKQTEFITSSVLDRKTSRTVVKQAAESNTSLACPDSSWDTCKMDVTDSSKHFKKNKSDFDLNSDTEEDINGESKDESCQSRQNSQVACGEISEWGGKNSSKEIAYKHKKFFHYRKRANSQCMPSSSMSGEAKHVKLYTASSTSSMDNACTTSSVCSQDHKITQSAGSNSANESDCEDVKTINSTITASVKSERTEARHIVPFVWDCTTRSQKKL